MKPNTFTIRQLLSKPVVADYSTLCLAFIVAPLFLMCHESLGLSSLWKVRLSLALALAILLCHGHVRRMLTSIFEGISARLPHTRVGRVAELLEQLVMVPVVTLMGLGSMHFLYMADHCWPVRHSATIYGFALFGWGISLILLGRKFLQRNAVEFHQ